MVQHIQQFTTEIFAAEAEFKGRDPDDLAMNSTVHEVFGDGGQGQESARNDLREGETGDEMS